MSILPNKFKNKCEKKENYNFAHQIYIMPPSKPKHVTKKHFEKKLKEIEQVLPVPYQLGKSLQERYATLSAESKERVSDILSSAIPITLTALFTILSIYRYDYLTNHEIKGGKLDLSDEKIVERMTLDFFDKFELLQEHKIIDMKICKTPVSEHSRKKLRLIAGVSYDKIVKELNVDDLYHTYFRLRLQKQNEVVDVVYEKNQFPEINPVDANVTPLFRSIKLAKSSLTFGEFVDKAFDMMGIDAFFTYNAIVNNCQIFMINHLKANNLGTNADVSFLEQKADILSEKYKDLAKDSEKWTNRLVSWDRFKNGAPTAKPKLKKLKNKSSSVVTPALATLGTLGTIGVSLYALKQHQKLQRLNNQIAESTPDQYYDNYDKYDPY